MKIPTTQFSHAVIISVELPKEGHFQIKKKKNVQSGLSEMQDRIMCT